MITKHSCAAVPATVGGVPLVSATLGPPAANVLRFAPEVTSVPDVAEASQVAAGAIEYTEYEMWVALVPAAVAGATKVALFVVVLSRRTQNGA